MYQIAATETKTHIILARNSSEMYDTVTENMPSSFTCKLFGVDVPPNSHHWSEQHATVDKTTEPAEYDHRCCASRQIEALPIRVRDNKEFLEKSSSLTFSSAHRCSKCVQTHTTFPALSPYINAEGTVTVFVKRYFPVHQRRLHHEC